MIETSTYEMDEILQMCWRKLGVFGRTFLPEAFNTKFTNLHYEILNLLDSGEQKIAIAAPRGLGKTTLAKSLVMRAILYRDYEFISYVSNSETLAELQTENIKRELRTNREIRRIFGDVAVSIDDPELNESFSKRSWVAYGNSLVMPRGAGQQVRGLLYKNFRPQLIIVDDLEKSTELDNPENRRKLKEWFFGDLMKCVDRYSDKWRIIYIDTLKHHDSLLELLLSSEDWKSVRLDLCTDKLESRVPELISTEELRREYEAHKRSGILDVFYREYRNMPVASENQGFRSEYFKYYSETDRDLSHVENIIVVDPAKTANMKSAESAIVGVGIDYASNAIYIRDIVSGKFHPDELYDELFNMKLRLNVHVIGIEVTGLEEFIKQPIQNEMLRRGPKYSFEPIWLKARGGPSDGEKGKLKRIGALVPYYRQGFIFHNETCCTKLEAQLLSFPRSSLIDVADATAYIIEMLELGGRYFSTPDDDPADSEREFDELEYDEPLGSEYRRV